MTIEVYTEDQKEEIVDSLLLLLTDKHSKYTPEEWCHYVVKGENEEECDSEDYCEKCIGKAVLDFSNKYKSKRNIELNRIKDLRRWGCCYSFHYNSEYGGRMLHRLVATEDEINNHEKTILEKYPDNIPFSYRRYRLDSETSIRLCEGCSVVIQSCVTMDEQELECWEEQPDSSFIIENMDDYIAYELLECLQFVRQMDHDIIERGYTLAERILKLNTNK